MYYDLVKFEFLDGYKAQLAFEDGQSGIVDFAEFIQQGGVFSRFSDESYFHKAAINKEWGILCWPDNVDIAPETLYLKAVGSLKSPWC